MEVDQTPLEPIISTEIPPLESKENEKTSTESKYCVETINKAPGISKEEEIDEIKEIPMQVDQTPLEPINPTEIPPLESKENEKTSTESKYCVETINKAPGISKEEEEIDEIKEIPMEVDQTPLEPINPTEIPPLESKENEKTSTESKYCVETINKAPEISKEEEIDEIKEMKETSVRTKENTPLESKEEASVETTKKSTDYIFV